MEDRGFGRTALVALLLAAALFWSCCGLGAADGESPDPCAALAKLGSVPRTVGGLRAALGEGRNLGSSQVRQLYTCVLAGTKAELDRGGWGPEPCERAAALSAFRSVVREYARERGSWLHHSALVVRDVWVYGSLSGPSFDDLLRKYGGGGGGGGGGGRGGAAGPDGAVCERIAEAALRSNAEVNALYDGAAAVAADALLVLAATAAAVGALLAVRTGCRRLLAASSGPTHKAE